MQAIKLKRFMKLNNMALFKKYYSFYIIPLFALIIIILISMSEYMMEWGSIDNGQYQVVHQTEVIETNHDLKSKDFISQKTVAKLPTRWKIENKNILVEIKFDLQELMNQSIFIPRISDRVIIMLNDKIIAQYGNGHFNYQQGKHPIVQNFNHLDLRLKNNIIWLQLEGRPHKELGLSEIYIGNYAIIHNMYKKHWLYEIGITIISISISFGIGVIGLLFGIRSHDKNLKLFGLAALAWSMRGIPSLWIDGGIIHDWPYLISDFGFGSYVGFIHLFLIKYLNLKNKYLKINALITLIATWIMIPIAYNIATPSINLHTIWLAILLISTVIASPIILKRIIKHKSRINMALFWSIILSIICGTYDFFVIQLSNHGFGQISLTRFAEMAFLLTLVMVILEKLFLAHELERNLNQELSHKIAKRERELAVIYEEKNEIQRQDALLSERARITQDMHDGLGMYLNTMYFMLKNKKSQPMQLLPILQDSIDQLRLTVDSINPTATTILSVLAQFRYRITDRLEESKIKLNWHIESSQNNDILNPQHILNIQYLLYEIISNIIKHAKANCIDVYYSDMVTEKMKTTIRITDNGIGFDPDVAPAGRGLAGMARRATAIGARLDIQSQPNLGTTILLQWTA